MIRSGNSTVQVAQAGVNEWRSAGHELTAAQRSSWMRTGVNPVPTVLDDYPGAATGLSLMLLRRAWAKEALQRVRRSSDDDEVDVLADLSLSTPRISLDSPLVGSAATYGDFIAGTDGFVRTIYDQTGNARHAQQATALSQPKCAAAGALLTRNGMPSMTYDGSDDLMTVDLPTIHNFAVAIVGVHRRETVLETGNRGFLGITVSSTNTWMFRVLLVSGTQSSFSFRMANGAFNPMLSAAANANDLYRAYIGGRSGTGTAQGYMRLHGVADSATVDGVRSALTWGLFDLGGVKMSGDLTTMIFWPHHIAANAQLEKDMAALHNITLPS